MTLDAAERTAPVVERSTGSPRTGGRLGWWGRVRWWGELAGVLAVLGFLIFDRVRLLQVYLTRTTDEDQAIEWIAAKEVLRGRFHEPCFFGQAYNSNLEGYLGAPLMAAHVPPWVALPVVTVVLSLVPFVVLSWVAWRRGQRMVSALALAVPMVLSTEYGVMTGMPRGFVTGVALAVVPAVLYLRVSEGLRPPSAGRRCHRWRYFLAGFFAVVAVTLNPNSAVLLGAVAVYAVLTRWREWRFWVFTAVGMLAACPYPGLVYEFYYVWHDDYRMHQRKTVWTWSWQNWHTFVEKMADPSFRYFFPQSLMGWAKGAVEWAHGHFGWELFAWGVHAPATMGVLVVFVVTGVWLLVRLRIAAFLAGCAGAAVVVVSFACSRIHDGHGGATLPWARMFLAVPVLWLWLLLLVPRERRGRGLRGGWRWMAWVSWVRLRVWPNVAVVGVLGICVWAGVVAVEKAGALGEETKRIMHSGGVTSFPVERVVAVSKEMEGAAKREGARFVLVGNYDRVFAYTMPVLTDLETMYPIYERRTWLMHEESVPRHERILVMGGVDEKRGKKFVHREVMKDPPVTVWEIKGKSVVGFCREVGLRVRGFEEGKGK